MVVLKKYTQPKSLSDHSAQWTKDLLDECDRLGDTSKVAENYWNKYRKDDIKKALEEESFGKCMYCDSKIGISDFEHIEHIKPKKKNPHTTYAWENLGWACSKCNVNKGEEEVPNPYEIDYEEILKFNGAMFLVPKDESDKFISFFISELDLNREKLVFKRCSQSSNFEQTKLKELEELYQKADSNLKYFIKELKKSTSHAEEYYMAKKEMLSRFVKNTEMEKLF